MMMAEGGDLRLNLSDVQCSSFLNGIQNSMTVHNAGDGKKVVIENPVSSKIIKTDPTILTRILINMVKNALEACVPDGRVTIGADGVHDNQVKFYVHNNAFIPRETQLQIFQRSYSTKGKNRGLGTYSMKLLGEQYLKGTVSFETSEAGGTTFFILLPESIDQND